MGLTIGCVVMAAGNASRFAQNKLTVEYDGKTLIRRALDAVPPGHPTVVVTQYPEIAALAERCGFAVRVNDAPELGASRTVRLGTEALIDCDGLVFLVADQPLLRRESVEALIAAWRTRPDSIACLSHAGKRGNPCLFPQDCFPALLRLEGDRGGSAVIRENMARVLLVETAAEELADVDTPAALEALRHGGNEP